MNYDFSTDRKKIREEREERMQVEVQGEARKEISADINNADEVT